MNTRNNPDGEENEEMTRDNERATFAAQRAISRFENNKHVETFDGSFWKTCAWAMADDLKRALKPSEPVDQTCEHGVSVENPCWQCDEEKRF